MAHSHWYANANPSRSRRISRSNPLREEFWYQEPSRDTFLQQTLNALQLGSIYAFLGYTMVYGILTMINFAHGDLFMIGAFFCFLQNLLKSAIYPSCCSPWWGWQCSV